MGHPTLSFLIFSKFTISVNLNTFDLDANGHQSDCLIVNSSDKIDSISPCLWFGGEAI